MRIFRKIVKISINSVVSVVAATLRFGFRYVGVHPEAELVLIVSSPRSGTTAFGSILSRLPNPVYYYNEHFGPGVWSSALYKIGKRYPLYALRYALQCVFPNDRCNRFKYEAAGLDPVRATECIMQEPGIHCFKIFPEHIHEKSLELIIHKFKPRLVFLRRNHLDRAVSFLKAQGLNQWHGIRTDDVPISIDREWLEEYIKENRDFYGRVYRLGNSERCRILDLDYESLFKRENVFEALSFVTAGNASKYGHIDMLPTTIKQDTSYHVQKQFLSDGHFGKRPENIADYDFPKLKISEGCYSL